MAKVYKITAESGLNIRSKASTSASVLGTITKGSTVTSDTQANGWAHLTWKGVTGYSFMQYMSLVSSTDDEKKSDTGSTQVPNTTTDVETPTTLTGNVDQTDGMSVSEFAKYQKTNSTDSSKKLFESYLRAFGCPPQFNKSIDLQYETSDGLGAGVGRRMAETFFVHPSILSLCPGAVSYLPGFTSKEKDQFLNAVKAFASGVDLGNTGDGLSGKLYEFKSAYTNYINTVNLLCRATAVYLGLGDVKMPGSSVTLKNYDYGYWTTPGGASAGSASIFGETKRALSSIISDNSYVHFFVTHQGTSLNESMDTSITASDLENTFNSSNLHSISRNLEFLFGGALEGSALESDINRALDDAGNTSDFIAQFGKLAKNYLSGGRLVFPQMIDTVGYSKSLSATLKFMSPYGDKLSIFLRCNVPSLHLLALTLPKQLSDNMYTYPYLVRAYQQGYCNFDLAVISNLRLTRGGTDNTSWTIDGLPTEIEASFDITPLYTNLMSSNVTQPFMFMQNTSLAEYLATMCGVDMKANNLWTKIDMAKMALQGKFTDIPTNLARSIIDTKLINGLQKFAQIIN